MSKTLHVCHYKDISAEKVETQGAEKVTMRWLISDKHGAPNFAMRMLHISAGGNTPYHNHGWEHENFVVEGSGTLVCEGVEYELSEGMIAYVPPSAMHQFKSSAGMSFLCMVPLDKKN